MLQINSRKKMLSQAAEGTTSNSTDPWSAFIYPFDDDTLVREKILVFISVGIKLPKNKKKIVFCFQNLILC